MSLPSYPNQGKFMYKKIILFVLVVFTGIMTGCGPIYNTEYTFIPPKSDMSKMCTAQCVQGKSACDQNCRLENENCRLRSQQAAIYEYNQYKDNQTRQGLPVNKTTRDFDTSGSCYNSCQCESTFRACYSACGGEVQERKVCVAFCDKKQ